MLYGDGLKATGAAAEFLHGDGFKTVGAASEFLYDTVPQVKTYGAAVEVLYEPAPDSAYPITKYRWFAGEGCTLTESKISSWVDTSSSIDLAQPSAASRPVLQTGIISETGSTVSFSGAEFLTTASLANAKQDWTIIIAFVPGGDRFGIYQYLLESETDSLIAATVEKRAARSGVYTTSDGWTTGDWMSGPQVMTIILDSSGGLATVRINGTQVNQNAYTGASLDGAFTVGANAAGTGSFLTGDIGEIAIFESVLTDDLEVAEGVVANDCGITSVLAAEHPYTSARFPYTDWGYSVGPTYQALIERVANGQERRTRLNDEIGQAFQIAFDDLPQSEMEEILAFFMAHYGQGLTFRFRDWRDYTLDREPCVGSGLSWQIAKKYAAGAYSYLRPILRPVPFSVTLWDNSGIVDETTYSIDHTTGVITFTTEPNGQLYADGEFDCLVRFAQDGISLKREPAGLSQITEIELQEVVR